MTSALPVRARWRATPYVLFALAVVPCAAVAAVLPADAAQRSGGDAATTFAIWAAAALLVFWVLLVRFARRRLVVTVDDAGVIVRGVLGSRRLAFADLVESWTVERRLVGFRIENVYWYDGPRGTARISELHQATSDALVAAVEQGRRAAGVRR